MESEINLGDEALDAHVACCLLTGWETTSIRLPASGHFKVVFQYVMGFPFSTCAAIDDVKITKCPIGAQDNVYSPGKSTHLVASQEL